MLMMQNLSGIRSEALIGRRSSFIVLGIVYKWQTKDKRPQRSVNTMNLLQNSQYLWSIFFSRRSIWVLLELIRRWTQHFSKINQEKCKIEQICFWNPMTTAFIMQTLIYVISVEFLSLSRRRSSLRNIPQRRWARRNVCRSQASKNDDECKLWHSRNLKTGRN